MDFIKEKELAQLATSAVLDLQPPANATHERLERIGVDGVVVDNFLSADECARLVQAAEASGGFTFWDPDGSEQKKSVRNADTVEFDDKSLCDQLYSRLLPYINPSVAFSTENEDTFETELEGEWVATGLNTHLLMNRYAGGGHFAPHADGSTVIDFNRRSLYTVLIYLNDCSEGGQTQLLTCLDGASMTRPVDGARVARPEAILESVACRCGRALLYYHQVLHAGAPVGKNATKYCLRSDVMYERRPPICTLPKDLLAYDLVREARAKEAAGLPMEALPLYMRAAKQSPAVAKACQLR